MWARKPQHLKARETVKGGELHQLQYHHQLVQPNGIRAPVDQRVSSRSDSRRRAAEWKEERLVPFFLLGQKNQLVVQNAEQECAPGAREQFRETGGGVRRDSPVFCRHKQRSSRRLVMLRQEQRRWRRRRSSCTIEATERLSLGQTCDCESGEREERRGR